MPRLVLYIKPAGWILSKPRCWMDGTLGLIQSCWVSPFPCLRNSLTVFLTALRKHLTFLALLCNSASCCFSNQCGPGKPRQTWHFPHRPLTRTHCRTQPVLPIDQERVYSKCFFLQGLGKQNPLRKGHLEVMFLLLTCVWREGSVFQLIRAWWVCWFCFPKYPDLIGDRLAQLKHFTLVSSSMVSLKFSSPLADLGIKVISLPWVTLVLVISYAVSRSISKARYS